MRLRVERVKKPSQVSAFELIDCWKNVTRELGCLGWKDVDDNESAERSKCFDGTSAVRKGRDWITAYDDECRDVSRLDLRNERRTGVLAKAAGEMWATFRSGFWRSICGGQRSSIELKEIARVKPHSTRAVVGVSDDVKRPE